VAFAEEAESAVDVADYSGDRCFAGSRIAGEYQVACDFTDWKPFSLSPAPCVEQGDYTADFVLHAVESDEFLERRIRALRLTATGGGCGDRGAWRDVVVAIGTRQQLENTLLFDPSDTTERRAVSLTDAGSAVQILPCSQCIALSGGYLGKPKRRFQFLSFRVGVIGAKDFLEVLERAVIVTLFKQ
jgi:hypothetical protein